MMRDQLLQHMVQRPFRPFRIRLADGRTFDIPHQNMGLAAESIFIAGIPAPDDPNPIYSDRTEWIHYRDIVGVELLPEPSTSSALKANSDCAPTTFASFLSASLSNLFAF